MEDFPIEENRFDFAFPLWAIASAYRGKTPVTVPIADPNIKFETGKTPEGVFLLLFTEDGHAQKFVDDAGTGGAVLMGLVGPPDTVRFLNEIVKRGVLHFTFDPVIGRTSVAVWPIQELINACERMAQP